MNSIVDVLGFNDKWLVIIGIPVVAFLMAAMMYGDLLVLEPDLFFSTCTSVALIYTVVYWLAFRFTIIFFRKKYPSMEDTGRRLVFQVITVVVGYFALKFALDPLIQQMFPNFHTNVLRHEIGMSIGSLLVTFLVLGIYETIGFYTRLQKSLVEKERLMKENVESQLESLRNQVNPHFFFNSLNTLVYLIPEAPVQAVNFVQKLSKAYRYILEIRDKQLVSLREELESLDAYACLQKERFGENLRIEINVGKEFFDYQMIPLCLQMLFENAIKHNVVSTQHPLTISVSIEQDNRLVVKNNLQRKKQEIPSTQVGLKNICSRYRFVTQREVEIITTQQSFIVILPLLKPAVVSEPNMVRMI